MKIVTRLNSSNESLDWQQVIPCCVTWSDDSFMGNSRTPYLLDDDTANRPPFESTCFDNNAHESYSWFKSCYGSFWS